MVRYHRIVAPSRGAGSAGGTEVAWRSPFIRNGYALILSSGISSALGVCYWLLAARLYSPAEIGVNSAMISLASTISGFAQLNLASALIRFLPAVGVAASSWILYSYAAVTAASLIGCAVALVVIAFWIPSLVLLVEEPWIALWFTLSTAGWSVFVIQDGILTGLRTAVWVLLKNTVFGFSKLAFLAALAGGVTYTAVFTSWYAPMIVVAAVVCLVIQREASRIHSAKAGGPSVPVRLRQVAHFAWADYLGTLFLYAAMGLMPVFVLHRFGPESSAIYFLCWTIAHALYLVSFSLGASLVAEGAADANNIRQLANRTQGHSLVLIIVGVLVGVPAAHWVLSLFGPEYSAQGTGLLRLLLLSALPFGFTCVLLNEARVMGHMKFVVFVQGALMVLVLGLGTGLSYVVGLIGTGIAWLSAQVLVALVLAVPVVRRWARPRRLERGVTQ